MHTFHILPLDLRPSTAGGDLTPLPTDFDPALSGAPADATTTALQPTRWKHGGVAGYVQPQSGLASLHMYMHKHMHMHMHMHMHVLTSGSGCTLVALITCTIIACTLITCTLIALITGTLVTLL